MNENKYRFGKIRIHKNMRAYIISLTYSTVYSGYVSIVRLILSSGSSICCFYLNNGQISVIAVILILVIQIIFFEIYVEKKKSDRGSFLNFDNSPKLLPDVTKRNL